MQYNLNQREKQTKEKNNEFSRKKHAGLHTSQRSPRRIRGRDAMEAVSDLGRRICPERRDFQIQPERMVHLCRRLRSLPQRRCGKQLASASPGLFHQRTLPRHESALAFHRPAQPGQHRLRRGEQLEPQRKHLRQPRWRKIRPRGCEGPSFLRKRLPALDGNPP